MQKLHLVNLTDYHRLDQFDGVDLPAEDLADGEKVRAVSVEPRRGLTVVGGRR